MISRRQVIGSSLAGVVVAGEAQAKSRQAPPAHLRSPNGRTVLSLHIGRPPQWSVRYDDKPVIALSGLGLWLAEGRLLGAASTLLGIERRQHHGAWTPLFGTSRSYDESHNEIILHLKDGAIRYDIIARAYDSGAALRYRLVDPGGKPRLRLMGERTQFRFPETARVYASRDEGEITLSDPAHLDPYPHPDLTTSSDAGPLADFPITVGCGEGVWALATESDRLHYPRAGLKPDGKGGLVSYLFRFPGRAVAPSGPGDTPEEAEFELEAGQSTPWRVLLLADTARGLIEQSSLIPTLATPNVLGNVSWVKAGRAIRVFRRPYNTKEGLEVVDFAEKHRLDYIEYDWQWYGDGSDGSDATKPIPGLDIEGIVNYARTRKIGVIVYVDRIPAMTQLDAICKTYQKWGIAGIKFGFVWEGRQSDNDFIFNLIKTCGEHGLLVSLHDNLRPAGLERTLPNYVALEGVRGNEQFPPARHNVELAYVRSISGPIDYTICYANANNQTTNAHQLALAAIYYNPLTFLYWYDMPDKYADKPWPELAWFDACPTTWDETRAVAGTIEDFVVVARRSGEIWFLGAITNELSRRIEIDLAFLDQGEWQATIYRDGEQPKAAWQTPVMIETRTVTRATRLKIDMNAAGGQAILFERRAA